MCGRRIHDPGAAADVTRGYCHGLNQVVKKFIKLALY